MPLMKMRLKEWRTVAAWTWQDMNTECPICQKRLDSTCIRASCQRPGESCPPLVCEWCRIHFHLHCIEQMALAKKIPRDEVACASCARKVGSVSRPELDAEEENA